MIVALCCTVLVLLAVPSHEQYAQDSTPTSPCPDVFTYEPRGSEPDKWFGLATLTSDVHLYSMWLNIVLDRPAINLGNWIGNSSTKDGVNIKIVNDKLEIGPQHPVQLRFFVQYDPRNPAPKLRALRLNGLTICNADDAPKPTYNQAFISNSYVVTTESRITKPVTVTSQNMASRPPQREPNFPVNPSIPNYPLSKDECGIVAGGNDRVPLINNGRFYERGEIPWLVAIYRSIGTNLQFICGGTLVSDRHIVTAAHCMYRRIIKTPISEIVIRSGVHSLNDWTDELSVISKIMAMSINEAYNPNTFENDILIFTLTKRVRLNQYIRPVCLWSGNTALSLVVGATGIVAGWGARAPGDIGRHDDPQMVRIPIVSTKECRASKSDFHKLTYNTTLCAGDRNGAGPCTGDSGGGLYLLEGGKWRLRGIVSVSVPSEDGSSTCNLNEYVVFTDTTQFLPWIRNILSEKYYD